MNRRDGRSRSSVRRPCLLWRFPRRRCLHWPWFCGSYFRSPGRAGSLGVAGGRRGKRLCRGRLCRGRLCSGRLCSGRLCSNMSRGSLARRCEHRSRQLGYARARQGFETLTHHPRPCVVSRSFPGGCRGSLHRPPPSPRVSGSRQCCAPTPRAPTPSISNPQPPDHRRLACSQRLEFRETATLDTRRETPSHDGPCGRPMSSRFHATTR